MTPADLRTAARNLGLSGNAMAAALGKSKRTYRRWLAGDTPVPHWVPAMIEQLREGEK